MRLSLKVAAVAAIALLALVITAQDSAAETAVSGDNAGDIAWILICSGLVFIMTPGVALFYGGMLRKQSMTSIMAQTLVVVAIMTLSWVIVGYTLAFGGDGTIIGSFDHVILNGIGYDDVIDGGIPELEFVMFQCAFALITAGIVIGACAERIHFKAIALFLIHLSDP